MKTSISYPLFTFNPQGITVMNILKPVTRYSNQFYQSDQIQNQQPQQHNSGDHYNDWENVGSNGGGVSNRINGQNCIRFRYWKNCD